jgi:CRP-like cAMP-binding protein
MMRDLRKNLIFELTKYLERVTFASKAILYSKGDRSDYFYFLRKGSVLVNVC